MPYLVPFLISALVGGFASSIVQGLVKLAISVGIGFLVFKGLDILLQNIMSHITYNIGNTPITGVLHLLKLDASLNVLASAVAVKYSLKATVNGLRKFTLK